MTIAVCYISAEGVVFGADSTTTVRSNLHGQSFVDHAQKVFEIGEASTLGAVTWGLGAIGETSHRLIVAQLADSLSVVAPKSVQEVADRLNDMLWNELKLVKTLANNISEVERLNAIDVRTPDQELQRKELCEYLEPYELGFFVGGYVADDRRPAAFEVSVSFAHGKQAPQKVRVGTPCLRGAPNMLTRMVNGIDGQITDDIRRSGKWIGSDDELNALTSAYSYEAPFLPMRDMLDFVYSTIWSTIKAMKFSHFPKMIGGPVEVGFITVDRRWRWSHHKGWNSATLEGDHFVHGEQ
jgi:hypothetical protein